MTETFRARVTAVHKNRWELAPDIPAVLSGRLRHAITSPSELPVVGDWVTAVLGDDDAAATIVGVEPRQGILTRKRPGDVRTDAVVEQPIAANVDLALLTMAVDADFSVRRLERYLTLAWDSGASPVVVLTKADEASPSTIQRLLGQAQEVCFGSPAVVTSALTGEGIAELRELLPPGKCAILLGSSGVGKSSLLNALADREVQVVSDVRDFDGKGKHTTTSRRLIELPWGAYLVDTPGLREIQLWGDEESLAGSFPDIETLAQQCHFTDCAHTTEPGCAVVAAVESGDLSTERLDSWRRLHRELAYLARRTDGAAARAQRRKWKSIAKAQKAIKRDRDLG